MERRYQGVILMLDFCAMISMCTLALSDTWEFGTLGNRSVHIQDKQALGMIGIGICSCPDIEKLTFCTLWRQTLSLQT